MLANLFRRGYVVRSLLAIPLARQLGLDALLLARLQIEGVPLDLLDNIFLQNLSLETPERTLHRFAVMDVNFCQRNFLSFRLLLAEPPGTIQRLEGAECRSGEHPRI
jgi:hypothetical protein